MGLQLIPENVEEGEIDPVFTKEFLVHLLVSCYSRRPPKLDQFNSQPLYPTEELLWDESIMNTEYYTGLQCLALPKLGRYTIFIDTVFRLKFFHPFFSFFCNFKIP